MFGTNSSSMQLPVDMEPQTMYIIAAIALAFLIAALVISHLYSKRNKKAAPTKGKSAQGFSLADIFRKKLGKDFYDALKYKLIEADSGVDFASGCVSELRHRVEEEKISEMPRAREIFKEILRKGFIENNFSLSEKTILFIVGVNGVGKTTTIAKLANMYKGQYKTLLVAADTFRAAAIEQLASWAEALGVDIVKGQQDGDPGSALFDALKKAESKEYELIISDTAGRFHNKENLMRQLVKMKKIAKEKFSGFNFVPILVLDSTVGGNGVEQAKVFMQDLELQGVILAKFDASAKGGVAFAVNNELKVPVLFTGTGEKPDNIERFDANRFIERAVGGE